MKQIGRYQVLEEIARGGMGVVYRARGTLGRDVALKVLLSPDPDPRFVQEARATAALRHPGIVAIHEAEKDHDGRDFLVMEWVEGGSLQDRINRGGPLQIDEAIAISLQLCDAMAYAHRRGVIHRDLKPHNVLLTPEGVAKLTDFGLGKVVNQSLSLTKTGQVMGTPAYMPPEQADGDKAAMGPASDIYSLGATIYALLTGVPPFEGTTPLNLIHAVLNKSPEPPSKLRSDVPPELDAICLRCLEKEPKDRFASMEELAAALRGEAELCLAPSRRRTSLLAAAGILVVGLLGALVVISGSRTPEARATREVPGSAQEVEPDVPEAAPALERAHQGSVEPEAQPAQSADPGERFERGKAHFRKGRYERAVEAFSEALEADPNHLEALRYRGWSYGRLGDARLAARDLEEVARRDPERTGTSYAQIGAAWFRAGRPRKAITAYGRSLEATESALVLIDRANAFIGVEDYEAALDDLLRAEALNPPTNQPANVEIPLGTGHVYRYLRRNQLALESYALALDRAGSKHRLLADIEEAIEATRSALGE